MHVSAPCYRIQIASSKKTRFWKKETGADYLGFKELGITDGTLGPEENIRNNVFIPRLDGIVPNPNTFRCPSDRLLNLDLAI